MPCNKSTRSRGDLPLLTLRVENKHRDKFLGELSEQNKQKSFDSSTFLQWAKSSVSELETLHNSQ